MCRRLDVKVAAWPAGVRHVPVHRHLQPVTVGGEGGTRLCQKLLGALPGQDPGWVEGQGLRVRIRVRLRVRVRVRVRDSGSGQ